MLLPNDPDNYYRDRELVPADMLADLGRAKIVITNYHAFQLRETHGARQAAAAPRSQGHGARASQTTETEGEMLQRVLRRAAGA